MQSYVVSWFEFKQENQRKPKVVVIGNPLTKKHCSIHFWMHFGGLIVFLYLFCVLKTLTCICWVPRFRVSAWKVILVVPVMHPVDRFVSRRPVWTLVPIRCQQTRPPSATERWWLGTCLFVLVCLFSVECPGMLLRSNAGVNQSVDSIGHAAIVSCYLQVQILWWSKARKGMKK